MRRKQWERIRTLLERGWRLEEGELEAVEEAIRFEPEQMTEGALSAWWGALYDLDFNLEIVLDVCRREIPNRVAVLTNGEGYTVLVGNMFLPVKVLSASSPHALKVVLVSLLYQQYWPEALLDDIRASCALEEEDDE